jgi:FkbM family methyltransferase
MVMSFVSYARNCEDVVLWRALRDVVKGFYVDIGGGDPETASATRAFYERGWFGINVQPVDEYYQRLVESRPHDTNLKVMAGREVGLRTLRSRRENGSSRRPGINLGEKAPDIVADSPVVPVLPISQVIQEVALSTIHFLKIDVEGDQADVIEGLDLQRVRPWIILVGAIDSEFTIGSRDRWEHLITERGYSFAYFDGLNCFYVADEIPYAKERLAAPPNPVDDFVRSAEQLNGQRAADLETQLVNLRIYSTSLESDLKGRSIQCARLERLLATTRSEAAKLNKALQVEQAQAVYLRNWVKRLEAHCDRSLVVQVYQLFSRLRGAGDRLTGGGLRALAKRWATKAVRSVRDNERLVALTSVVLKPVPRVATYLFDSHLTPRENESSERVPLPALEERTQYDQWVAAHDTINQLDRSMIRAHLSSLTSRPLVSVILLTGAQSKMAVSESFKSVVTQLCENWELCVAVDAVVSPQIEALLCSSVVRDPRVKVIRLDSSLSVAAATNAALNLATGEFVAFLRAGDILPEHALYEVVLALGRDERIEILYTDQDQINPDGRRSNPWFKPGWDPDLLLAQDYINHLAVYRRSLVEAVGFLRTGFDEAELYDLALRASARTGPDRIHHLPAILYHRCSEKGRNRCERALPTLRAIRAAHRAVRDQLDSLGNTGTLIRPAPQLPSANRVIWPMPEPNPLVSVIIPTRDHADLLAQCVEGVLQRTDYSNIEILIIDNGSTEPATATLLDRLRREERRVRVLRHPGPFNYSVMNNAAARSADGEILLLLNNDVDVIESGWLREMVSQAVRPDVGIVGAKLIYANETIQHGGVILGPGGQMTHVHRFASRNDPGYRGQLSLVRTLSAVTGACVAIRRTVFFEVGGFDEVNLQVGCNDIDLCLRIREFGYRVIWTPFAELFHVESASRGYDDFKELFQLESVSREDEDGDPSKRERGLREWQHMCKTWGAMMRGGDPYHNPNLLFDWDHLENPSSPRRKKPWHAVFQAASASDQDAQRI